MNMLLQLPPGSQGTLESLAAADSAAAVAASARHARLAEIAAPAPAPAPALDDGAAVTFGAATFVEQPSEFVTEFVTEPLSVGATAPGSALALGQEWASARRNGDSVGRTPFVGAGGAQASPAASPPPGNPARRRNLLFGSGSS